MFHYLKWSVSSLPIRLFAYLRGNLLVPPLAYELFLMMFPICARSDSFISGKTILKVTRKSPLVPCCGKKILQKKVERKFKHLS